MIFAPSRYINSICIETHKDIRENMLVGANSNDDDDGLNLDGK